MARDAVWASNLVRVNTFICFTYIGHGEEGGVQSLLVCRDGGTLLSLKRAKKAFSLSGSATSVSVTRLFFFL